MTREKSININACSLIDSLLGIKLTFTGSFGDSNTENIIFKGENPITLIRNLTITFNPAGNYNSHSVFRVVNNPMLGFNELQRYENVQILLNQGTKTHGNVQGFFYCKNLSNCIVEDTSGGSGYSSCINLQNCQYMDLGYDLGAVGFFSCRKVSYCISDVSTNCTNYFNVFI